MTKDLPDVYSYMSELECESSVLSFALFCLVTSLDRKRHQKVMGTYEASLIARRDSCLPNGMYK